MAWLAVTQSVCRCVNDLIGSQKAKLIKISWLSHDCFHNEDRSVKRHDLGGHAIRASGPVNVSFTTPFLPSQMKYDGNWFCAHPNCHEVIAIKFCTWQDRCAHRAFGIFQPPHGLNVWTLSMKIDIFWSKKITLDIVIIRKRCYVG